MDVIELCNITFGLECVVKVRTESNTCNVEELDHTATSCTCSNTDKQPISCKKKTLPISQCYSRTLD